MNGRALAAGAVVVAAVTAGAMAVSRRPPADGAPSATAAADTGAYPAEYAPRQADTMAYAQPEPLYGVEVTKDVMVPMRDGVRLATDLYMPVGAGDRLPVVLIRLPYNKDRYRGAIAPAELFAGQGYAVVVQDVRGQNRSEGVYQVQDTDADDGWDAVDWAAKQPWSTGKVGTYGCSYLGEVQLLLAKRRHPAHLAAIPQSAHAALGPAGGFYTDFGVYEGGALTLSTIVGWFRGAGHKVKGVQVPAPDFRTLLRTLPVVDMDDRAGYPASDFDDFVSHPPADPYWRQMEYLTDADTFAVPALHVNSWLDLTAAQALYTRELMARNAASQVAADNQFAIISPATHCGSERAGEHTVVGQRDVGDARLPYWRIYLDWFDYWLRGEENRVTERPKIEYFVMGEDGAGHWRAAETWPAPEMRPVAFHLSSDDGAATAGGDGMLRGEPPRAGGTDSFVYDPADPFPSLGGTICCTGNPDDQPGIFDLSALESRPDLLVYSTLPLQEPLTIAGDVKAVLYVSSDAKDTDITAKLLDVDEEGRAWNVSNGILRLRYREGMERTVWMEDGAVYPVEVSLKATAHRFEPGHRVRLHISSSDFPMYDRNLNTGEHNALTTELVKATNTIHFGADRPSRLILPVVPSRE